MHTPYIQAALYAVREFVNKSANLFQSVERVRCLIPSPSVWSLPKLKSANLSRALSVCELSVQESPQAASLGV